VAEVPRPLLVFLTERGMHVRQRFVVLPHSSFLVQISRCWCRRTEDDWKEEEQPADGSRTEFCCSMAAAGQNTLGVTLL
jgi:hypothetical protein